MIRRSARIKKISENSSLECENSSQDSMRLTIVESPDEEENALDAGTSGARTIGEEVSKKRSASISSVDESFESMSIPDKHHSEKPFESPARRKFTAKSNSKNRRTSARQSGTPNKKLKFLEDLESAAVDRLGNLSIENEKDVGPKNQRTPRRKSPSMRKLRLRVKDSPKASGRKRQPSKKNKDRIELEEDSMPALEAIPEPELVPVASSNHAHHLDSTVDRLGSLSIENEKQLYTEQNTTSSINKLSTKAPSQILPQNGSSLDSESSLNEEDSPTVMRKQRKTSTLNNNSNKRKRTPKKPEKTSTNETVVRVVSKLTWSSLDSTDDDDDGASVSGIPRANKSVNLFPKGVTSTSDSSETSDFDDDVPTISFWKNVRSSTGRPSKDPEIITDTAKNKPEMIARKTPEECPVEVRVEVPEEYRPTSSVESGGTKSSPMVTAVVDGNLPVQNALPSSPEEPTVPDDATITSETPSLPDFDDVPMIRLNESRQQERKSTPKKTKINKTIADIFNETFERLERFRPSSPDESIASSRGRRSLPKTNLKETQTGDETNTDDFFDSPSDYQPTDSEKDDKRKSPADSSESEEENQSVIEKPKKKSPELLPAIRQKILSPRKPIAARSREDRRPVLSRPKKNSPKTDDRTKSTRTPKTPKTTTTKQIRKNSLLDTSTQSTKWKSKEYISSSSSDSDGDQLPVIPRPKKKSPNGKAINETKSARTPKTAVQRKAKKNTSLDTSTQSTIRKSKEYISTSSDSEEDQQSFAEKLKKKSSKLVHPPKSTTTPTKESSKSPQKAISDEDSTTEVPDENSETRTMPDLEDVSNSVVPDPVFSSALVPIRKKSLPELDELSETISTDDEAVLPPAKKLKRPIKTREKNKSHEYESDVSGEELFIETELLAPDDDIFEVGKEKSVFDEISSSETDSDVEEVYEPKGRKNAGERRKFSSLQKMKDKYLEEIVGWLPWKRNTVSILIETIRDKLLKREFDGIDEILKALVIRIGSPSRVAIGTRVQVSSLVVLTPIIFSQLPEQLPESVIRQFEPEDQKAFLSYLNKNVVKRRECEMEPIIQNLLKLTLENDEQIENQIKILSDTIHDIDKVFSSQTKSRKSVGDNKENHQPKVDHLLLCLLFQLEFMQIKGSRDAQVLAEKIVSKIKRSPSHQRVGIQALGSIMRRLKEIGVENETTDKWNAIVVETSYSGAGEDELQRMKMKDLKKEFANNRTSEAGFQLAKILKSNGQPVEAAKTLIEYVSYNRVKCDLSVHIWEFLRSLLEEKEALEWFKEVRGLGSPQSFRKMFLKLSIDNPVEVAEVKRKIREMCI